MNKFDYISFTVLAAIVLVFFGGFATIFLLDIVKDPNCEPVITNVCKIEIISLGENKGIYRRDYEHNSCTNKEIKVFSDRLSIDTDAVTKEFWGSYFHKCSITF